MENELTRYSRAGDAFHYRWAARRCLRMLYPKSLLLSVVIEGSGSKERELAGEYVIDIAEYSDTAEGTSQEVGYFQLKHTTVRKSKPFNLGDLRDTIAGFAARFLDHANGKSDIPVSSVVTFSIVTNRPISENFKNNVLSIANGERSNARFLETFKKYTKLNSSQLSDFCKLLHFVDNVGDYDEQKLELQAEIAQILAGTVDSPQVDSVVALVQDRALPNSDGKILREDVLKRFGCSSERELYPALPQFEKIEAVIPRQQQTTLLQQILEATTPVIIHAAGGVGKSVFAQQIAQALPKESLGIVYDCFGGGRYLNRSELRHRHRDALVQIVNELASHGLCEPLIAQSSALEDEIIRKFLTRIAKASESLRKSDKNANLVILIDAADNAEMAADIFGDNCFVHELLREAIPEGCRIVALCRSERVHLLRPSESIAKFELEPFSVEETFNYLKMYFPQASDTDGLELYRLSNNGNPRVQANALNLGLDSIADVLASLGPKGTTVEKQIEAQLDAAISNVKEKFPINYQKHIDAICLGLATLPPLIPITVLAKAAEVTEAAVTSFVSDLGRPLWLSDTSVQFRDEPTETWFRERFSATPEQIISYVERLEPLAYHYPYVAETIPSLLLQAEKYSELIDLALSDDFLPKDNPIDARNVRIYRLQFAFKAALKQKRYVDATKLALRAGEEVAGDKRQLELFKNNVDLIAPLQSEQRVQDLAFRRLIRGGWDGSENVYSGSLLSTVANFKGETRGYLRAAENWLRLYFEERKKKSKHFQETLEDNDIVELALTHFNLFGVEDVLNFIFSWRPPEVTYRISNKFIERLIDLNNLSAIDEIAGFKFRGSYLRYQYMIIAIAKRLIEIGKFPPVKQLTLCLDLLSASRTRIPVPKYSYDDTTVSAIISLLEGSAVAKLPKAQILRVLRHYVPLKAPQSVSRDIERGERNIFLRAVALRCVLDNKFEPNLDDLLPDAFSGEKEKTYRYDQDIRNFKEVVGGLLPWYVLRARTLVESVDDLTLAAKEADEQSKKARAQRWRDSDVVPYEISRLCLEILTFYENGGPFRLDEFFQEYIKGNEKIWIQDRLSAVRSAFRLIHLSSIRRELERSAYELILSLKNEDGESRAGWYVDLARAVLPVSRDDASTYFDYAIDAVSKFGDEIVQRWNAVAALGNRSSEGATITPEIVYRFIRCAELIGDNVVREKYFDRNGAIRICARLSTVSALSALSRWRDRDVGWFDEQLTALADELVRSNSIMPRVGWSLSAFFQGFGLDDFTVLCLEKEKSLPHRQYILDTAIRNLRLNEASETSWQKLKTITQELAIENKELEEILAFYVDNPEKEAKIEYGISSARKEVKNKSNIWETILQDLDLTTSLGISEAIRRFDTPPDTDHDFRPFWQGVVRNIDEKDAVKFLRAIANAEKADRYDIQQAITYLPGEWFDKVSVKRYWPSFVRLVASRFASELTNFYILENFRDSLKVDDFLMSSVRQGILDGLSENTNFANADTFFSFVEIVPAFISPQQAAELLDYALTRFELHIDDKYADGPWADWLNPPEDITTAFAGFVWSALGSPRTETRWRAAHCVRTLAELGCQAEIDALIEWMEKDTVDAFGSNKFPFYNLHACLYLLIALARVSINHPEVLKHHFTVFSRYSLESMPHLLIQKFSADIALNIDKAFPGTYESTVIEKLHKVGISRLPLKDIEGHGEEVDSYWHEQGLVDTSLEHLHGYDFDRYWFEPLGNVFGIPGKQVDELAVEVVVKEWNIKYDGSYDGDPRVAIWRSTRNEKETWHDHGSYPRVDRYSFYLSYHSMFVVAAKLLQKMPVIYRKNWHENEWEEWVSRHLLTRKDGGWLSDRRDPAPLLPKKWSEKDDMKSWRSGTNSDDFLDALLFERNAETWLHAFGFWEESDGEREESFRISSALVSPVSSQALLNAMANSPDPYDHRLPEYDDDEMEFEKTPFELKGWVGKAQRYNKLDEFDPFAGEIGYPPYEVGQRFMEKFNLVSDAEQRQWFLPENELVILSELWRTNRPQYDKDSLRRGERLSASLSFLKNLCKELGYEIIFRVHIERSFRPDTYSYNKYKDENGYTEPFKKIYILSADGKLRDSETGYQLR